MKNEAGFSLIELLIVILIIGIIAAIALPQLTKSRKTANEAAAIQQLIRYTQGELMFSTSNNGYYGDPAELLEAGAISDGLAAQLGANGTPVSKNGYEGSASDSGDAPGGLGTRYAAELHPTSPGTSGDRYFATDTSGTVYEATAAFNQSNGELSMPSDARSIQ